MSRLYTRTGDLGETSLLGGGRVSKADPRVEAYGTVDETNACVGAALVEVMLLPPSETRDAIVRCLEMCQDGLMRLAAQLAGDRGDIGVTATDVERVERAIDDALTGLPELAHFLVPGVSRAEAALHVARAVCRRAERRVVAMWPAGGPAEVLRFLNRLSDLLFALARVAVALEGRNERAWKGGGA